MDISMPERQSLMKPMALVVIGVSLFVAGWTVATVRMSTSTSPECFATLRGNDLPSIRRCFPIRQIPINEDGYNPLTFASVYHRPKVIQYLLEAGYSACAPSPNGIHPLQYSVDDAQCLKLLLDAGANPNEIFDIPRVSALMSAVSAENDASVQMLIERGANVNLQIPLTGRTALHAAASSGNRRIVDILLKAGARVTALDKQGYSAADVAKRTGHSALGEHIDGLKERQRYENPDISTEVGR